MELDLENLGTLAVSATGAKRYRVILVKSPPAVTLDALEKTPRYTGDGLVLELEAADGGGSGVVDLKPHKAAIESKLGGGGASKGGGAGGEIATFVVGFPADDESGATAVAGPTLTVKRKAEESPSSTVEEKRYDYFKKLVTETIPGLVAQGKMGVGRDPVEFAEGEGAINMLGIRSMTDWQAHGSTANAWDDWLVYAWIEGGKKRCTGYKGTTDPGNWSEELLAQYKLNPGGAAHLCDGQWRYRAGTHHGAPAANPNSRSQCWKDKDFNHERSGSETVFWTNSSGCNIHYGSSVKSVGLSSAGCQVLCCNGAKDPLYAEFIGRIHGASNKSDFPYTLIDSSLLPGPIPT